MSDRLKIYACSGVGSKNEQRIYSYWLDNTKTVSNTQAVNRLLAMINYDYVRVQYENGLTDKDVQYLLDDIDMLSVSLYYAQQYKDSPADLHHAGVVIGHLIKQGFFSFGSLDNNERDAHLDELLDKMEKLIEEDYSETDIKDFLKCWKETVEDANKVGFSESEQKIITEALNKSVAGVGDTEDIYIDADIGKYLSDAGTYFLYTFFTDEQLQQFPVRNRNIFKRKAITQKNLHDYCAAVFVQKGYGSTSYMDTLIRTGIVKDFGCQPEKVCQDLASGKRKGVGEAIVWTASLIIKLLIVLTPIIVGIVAAICNAVVQVAIAKYGEIDAASQTGGAPHEDDFDGIDGWGNNNTSSLLKSDNLLWIGGAALALFLLFRK